MLQDLGQCPYMVKKKKKNNYIAKKPCGHFSLL